MNSKNVAYKLKITPRAAFDVIDACAWYEIQQTGLSHLFLSDVDKAYKDILDHPEQYSYISTKRKNNLRDVGLKKFPYIVVYDIVGEIITVYTVFNTYRKPRHK